MLRLILISPAVGLTYVKYRHSHRSVEKDFVDCYTTNCSPEPANLADESSNEKLECKKSLVEQKDFGKLKIWQMDHVIKTYDAVLGLCCCTVLVVHFIVVI